MRALSIDDLLNEIALRSAETGSWWRRNLAVAGYRFLRWAYLLILRHWRTPRRLTDVEIEANFERQALRGIERGAV